MNVGKINQDLMKAGALWKAFEKAACANSASDRQESIILQDSLTELRNHLNLLNSEIDKQIREMGK